MLQFEFGIDAFALSLPIIAVEFADPASLPSYNAESLCNQGLLIGSLNPVFAKRSRGNESARLVNVAQGRHGFLSHGRVLPIVAQPRRGIFGAEFVCELFREVADSAIVVFRVRC